MCFTLNYLNSKVTCTRTDEDKLSVTDGGLSGHVALSRNCPFLAPVGGHGVHGAGFREGEREGEKEIQKVTSPLPSTPP